MAEKQQKPAEDVTSGAIDLMYFPPARRGDQISCHEPVAAIVQVKKESGLGYVFITQCKRWSCDRRVYCDDASLDDILRYTAPHPEHFIGIAGYNPWEIGSSIHEAEIGIHQHGFCGVYVHPGSFGLTLSDRRMYPLYVKALEWHVPVVLDVRPLTSAEHLVRPAELEQVAGDFSGLGFVIAQPQWSGEEMLRLIENLANMYFCFDTPSLLAPEVRKFVNHPAGQTRCMWGSNGLPWKEALSEVARLGNPNTRALLRHNAVRLFGIDHLRPRKAKRFVESERPLTRIVAE
jgi:predicted TIM-barrel fold metal-dependent hydrolase